MGKVEYDIDDEIEIVNPEMIFTDRHNPRRIFWQAYDALSSDEFYVINYHGFGGIGKSRLCAHLCETLKEGVHPETGEKLSSKAFILNLEDLKNNCEKVDVVENLANKFEAECKYSFPLFKYGLYVYYRAKGKNHDSPEIKRIQDNKLGGFFFDAVGAIPVVGSIGSALLKGADSFSAAHKESVIKNSEYIKKLDDFRDSTEDIAVEIIKIFAKELREQTRLEEKPVVVFLDTYEQMQNYVYQTASAKVSEEWLWSRTGLIRRIPNVLWVLAGQRKVTWGNEEAFWRSEENIIYEEIHEIKEDDELKKMLKTIGIEEDPIIDVIVNKTNGVPVHLALCKDVYFDMKQEGKTPAVENFDMGYEKLASRFIGGLRSELKDIVDILACLGSWTDEDVARLGISADSFEYIVQLSFITKNDGIYKMHNSVRDIVIRACSSINVNKCQKYFEKCIGNSEYTLAEIKNYIFKKIELEIWMITNESDSDEKSETIKLFEEKNTAIIVQNAKDYNFFVRIKELICNNSDYVLFSDSFRKKMDIITIYHYAKNGEFAKFRSYLSSKQVMVGHLKLEDNIRGFLYFAMSEYEKYMHNYENSRSYLIECLGLWNKEENIFEYLDALSILSKMCSVNLKKYNDTSLYSDIGLKKLESLNQSNSEMEIALFYCKFLVDKCRVERVRGNVKDAIDYLENAEKKIDKYYELDNEEILYQYAIIYQQYVFLYTDVKRQDLRKEYALKDLEISKRIYDIHANRRNLRSLAISYEGIAKASSFKKGKEYYDKSIELYKELYQNQPNNITYSEYFRSVRIAADYATGTDNEEALKYIERCKEIMETSCSEKIDFDEIYYFYRCEINYYLYTDQHSICLDKMQKLDAVLEERKPKLEESKYLDLLSWNYREYGVIYNDMSMTYDALRYYEKENNVEYRLYKNFYAYKDGISYADSCRVLAKTYRKKNMYAQALHYAKIQLEIEKARVDEFKSIKMMQRIDTSLKILAETYELSGDKEAAIRTYEEELYYLEYIYKYNRVVGTLSAIWDTYRDLEKYYYEKRMYKELLGRYCDLLNEYSQLLRENGDQIDVDGEIDYIKCVIGKILYITDEDLSKARKYIAESKCPFSEFKESDREFYLDKIDGKLRINNLLLLYPNEEEKKQIMDGTFFEED